MIVTFTPTEGDTRTYEFKPRLLPNSEAELLEKLTGKSYQSFVQDATSGNALARRALVFMFEKRTHPTLKWDAFDFPYGAVEVEYDRDEFAAMREAIEGDRTLDDDARASLVESLREFEESAPEVPSARAERRERLVEPFARIYGIRPWDMDRLTVEQFDLLADAIEEG